MVLNPADPVPKFTETNTNMLRKMTMQQSAFGAKLRSKLIGALFSSFTASAIVGCGLGEARQLNEKWVGPSNDNKVDLRNLAEMSKNGLPPESKRVIVPGFEGGSRWLNVEHPLSKQDLQGRVVLVDFWTSGCINCIHTLPKLQRIEHFFANKPFITIGVHSPKFSTEQQAERLDLIADYYQISHPIVIDSAMNIWRAWNTRAWPTLVLLDAQGRAVWAQSGEPDEKELITLIERLIAEAQQKNISAKGPLQGLVAKENHSSGINYPSKVITLTNGDLAISDTGNNRIVITSPQGKVQYVIGNGQAGWVDGAYDQASFYRPHGLAQKDDILFVADTENHLVRSINLKTRMVQTIAGTGELGKGPLGPDEQPAKQTPIRSPWDIVVYKGSIIVTLAGSHQLVAIDPARSLVWRLSGSGKERRKDGEAANAAFAQPSGICTDGSNLFVVDAESSSVRKVNPSTGETSTVIGHDLFVFGDKDGPKEQARLQHPIGITCNAQNLIIADTYNSKLKKVDPNSGLVTTLIFSGVTLKEPSGLSQTIEGDIWVADTHNHRLIRLRENQPANILALEGLPPASKGLVLRSSQTTDDLAQDIEVVSVRWALKTNTTRVKLVWGLPIGTTINDQAAVKIKWLNQSSENTVFEDVRVVGALASQQIEIPIKKLPNEKTTLEGILQLVTCDSKTHQVCVPIKRKLRAAVQLVNEGAIEAQTVPLPPAN